jgi:hypothetical protein
MKSLLKLAMGAAIAGALVNALMKQRSRRNTAADSYGDDNDLTTQEFTPTELVADTSSVGEGSGDTRVQIPDDGRVAPGKLNS